MFQIFVTGCLVADNRTYILKNIFTVFSKKSCGCHYYLLSDMFCKADKLIFLPFQYSDLSSWFIQCSRYLF